jgi:hypothetical protein
LYKVEKMNNFVLIFGNINDFNSLRMGLVCLIFRRLTESAKHGSYPQGINAALPTRHTPAQQVPALCQHCQPCQARAFGVWLGAGAGLVSFSL